MLILTIRTDKPEAEIGLYEGDHRLVYQTWQAHRKLSATIHTQIATLLKAEDKQLEDLQGIVIFQGPGSFTGLRLGMTVANAITYSLSIPIVATRGDDWLASGIERLHAGENDQIALPHYGAEAHITQQRH